ncbi:hypothetical protein L596_024714 [Steinernema carpocapsae]|uniref:Uncharacterized protein n=1 Tax=Steinernema carpocapsae TaxID=34508 RepID=A0A4U5M5I9_STECR|nr:hypothetical protein L596_024714 [Steinernema carpocapsae]
MEKHINNIRIHIILTLFLQSPFHTFDLSLAGHVSASIENHIERNDGQDADRTPAVHQSIVVEVDVIGVLGLAEGARVRLVADALVPVLVWLSFEADDLLAEVAFPVFVAFEASETKLCNQIQI